MKDQSASIDPQVFERTARLFEEKRRVLPLQVLEGFARQVVSRVAETVATRAANDEPRISSHQTALFCDLLLVPDQPQVALDFITARRADGATTEDVYLGYIGSAASLPGARWEEGMLTPLQVTIGAGTLYALMRAMRSPAHMNHAPDHRRAALFATVPGEKHGIGITVAADMFRMAGWDIDLQIGLDHAQLIDRARHTRPAIIGLSLSTSERLAEMLKVILALRLLLPAARIGVAPGGDLTRDDVQRIADVDIVFGDAASAISLLDDMIAGETRS